MREEDILRRFGSTKAGHWEITKSNDGYQYKMNLHFAGKVVRKDLTNQVKGNTVFLPTTDDEEDTINQGIQR